MSNLEHAFPRSQRIYVDGIRVGIVVDAVSEVLRVSEEDIEPPSPIVTTVAGDTASSMCINNAFITGIAKTDDGRGTSGRLIIILDLDEVLSTDERVVLKEMT